jgi:hypothetical protein
VNHREDASREALKPIASLIATSEKARQKPAPGTSQYDDGD